MVEQNAGRLTFGGVIKAEDRKDVRSLFLARRFVLTSEMLEVYYPDGRRFLTTIEFSRQAEQNAQWANQEQQRADQERQRADRLVAQLKALGVNPEET
jgi:hypothetical protein